MQRVKWAVPMGFHALALAMVGLRAPEGPSRSSLRALVKRE